MLRESLNLFGCFYVFENQVSIEKKHNQQSINLSCYIKPLGISPSTTYHRASLAYIQQHNWLQFSPIALPLADWLRTLRKEGTYVFLKNVIESKKNF